MEKERTEYGKAYMKSKLRQLESSGGYDRLLKNHLLTFGTSEKPVSDYENRINALNEDKPIYLRVLLETRVSYDDLVSSFEERLKNAREVLDKANRIKTREDHERAIEESTWINEDGKRVGYAHTVAVLNLESVIGFRPAYKKEMEVNCAEGALINVQNDYRDFIADYNAWHGNFSLLSNTGNFASKIRHGLSQILVTVSRYLNSLNSTNEKFIDEREALDQWFKAKEFERGEKENGRLSDK